MTRPSLFLVKKDYKHLLWFIPVLYNVRSVQLYILYIVQNRGVLITNNTSIFFRIKTRI